MSSGCWRLMPVVAGFAVDRGRFCRSWWRSWGWFAAELPPSAFGLPAAHVGLPAFPGGWRASRPCAARRARLRFGRAVPAASRVVLSRFCVCSALSLSAPLCAGPRLPPRCFRASPVRVPSSSLPFSSLSAPLFLPRRIRKCGVLRATLGGFGRGSPAPPAAWPCAVAARGCLPGVGACRASSAWGPSGLGVLSSACVRARGRLRAGARRLLSGSGASPVVCGPARSPFRFPPRRSLPSSVALRAVSVPFPAAWSRVLRPARRAPGAPHPARKWKVATVLKPFGALTSFPAGWSLDQPDRRPVGAFLHLAIPPRAAAHSR